jgi:uncharacterized protein YegP (UPF0339 family)
MADARFVISRSTDNQFYFNLIAPNNEKILTSERYTAKANAHKGIESVKTNAPSDEAYDRRVAKDGSPYFVLIAANHEVIGKSEMYSSNQARDKGIEAVKTHAVGAATRDES